MLSAMCEGTGRSRTIRRPITRTTLAGLTLLILSAVSCGLRGEATGREAYPTSDSGRGTDTADVPGQVLTPAARIRVSVIDRTGQVVARAVTQLDGSYEIAEKEPPGRYELHVDGRDQGLDEGDVPFATSGNYPQELKCRISPDSPPQCLGGPDRFYQKPIWLFGRILKPAAGARIEVSDYIGFVLKSATANADGRFLIRGIQRDHNYYVSAIPTPPIPFPMGEAPRIAFAVRPQIVNLGTYYNSVLQYSPGPKYVLEHRQMLAEAESGGLVGAVFERLEGVQVRLRNWAGDQLGGIVPGSETITDPDGAFRITKDLGPHTYVLDFGPPSLSITEADRRHSMTGTRDTIDPFTGVKTHDRGWKDWPRVSNKSGFDCTIFPIWRPRCGGGGIPDRDFPPRPNGVTGYVGGPLKGVKVMLVASSGKVVRTATTDADGLYMIPAAVTGEYCLRVITGSDWKVDPQEVTMSPYELNLLIVTPHGDEHAHLEFEGRSQDSPGPGLFDEDFVSDKAGNVCRKLGLNYVEPVY
jgi:hypothetical protein